MFKFFRQLRQSYIFENKNSKYLKYAIGEIVLVVIGILIALQVNNWNEERIKQKAVKTALIQIQNELLGDLEESYDLTSFLEYKDSLIEKVLKNKVTELEYKTNGDLRFLITSSAGLTLNRDGFTGLMNIIDESKLIDSDLLNQLKGLYVDGNHNLEVVIDWYSNSVHEYNNELMKNYWWYSNRDVLIDSLVQDELDYLMYDPIYKNRVARYHNLGIGNLNYGNYQLQAGMAHLYRSISEVTGEGTDNEIIASYFNSPPDSIYAPFLGTYSRADGTSLKLFVLNDSLKIQFPYPSGEISYMVGGRRNRFLNYESIGQIIIENDSTLRSSNMSRNRYVRIKQ